ncbi:MAG: serpin family protein [Victivallales bacterium]|nr:serpin family protein [Victivallales bacterium]
MFSFHQITALFLISLLSVSAVLGTEASKAINASVNRPGFLFLGDMVKSAPNENAVVSPFSIACAMGMVRNGARGESASGLEQLFGSVIGCGESLRDAMKTVGDGGKVQVALSNRLWHAPQQKVTDAYRKSLQDYFGAFVKDLDFGNAVQAAAAVNQAVAEDTRGLIKELVKPDTFNAGTAMVLVNTLYFKGGWMVPFAEDMTHDAAFTNADGSQVPCKMMFAARPVPMIQDAELGVSGLVLPYKNDAYQLVALLPEQGRSTAVILDALAGGKLNYWLERTSDFYEIRMFLPKLTVEGKSSLRKAMEARGAGALFSSRADLSGISGDRSMKLDDVLHAVKLEMNERMTEAAAATAAIAMRMSLRESKEFRFDRPFVLVLVERRTGAALFAAVINKM